MVIDGCILSKFFLILYLRSSNHAIVLDNLEGDALVLGLWFLIIGVLKGWGLFLIGERFSQRWVYNYLLVNWCYWRINNESRQWNLGPCDCCIGNKFASNGSDSNGGLSSGSLINWVWEYSQRLVYGWLFHSLNLSVLYSSFCMKGFFRDLVVIMFTISSTWFSLKHLDSNVVPYACCDFVSLLLIRLHFHLFTNVSRMVDLLCRLGTFTYQRSCFLTIPTQWDILLSFHGIRIIPNVMTYLSTTKAYDDFIW